MRHEANVSHRENGIDDPDTNDNCRVSLASFGAPAEELPIYLRHLCREAWQPHVAKLMARIGSESGGRLNREL